MKMSKQRIVPIPSIPPQLIEAINNDQLAIFFGAGTSMLIGCSNWEKLASDLIEKCFTTNKNGETGLTCINYKERETLSKMKDPKKIITICQYILESNGSRDEFYSQIEESLKPNQKLLEKHNIYTELQGLRGLFITTNIDMHFDEKFRPDQIVVRKEDFNPSNIDTSKLYHIHGSLSDPSSVVITVKQYFDRYNDDLFQTFLKTIFEEKVILFIGYGLSEFEVLDFLITKSKVLPTEEGKHFILLPYFSGEETLVQFEKHYFSQMGITVIPYRKDEKGYVQLFDIIKEWNQEILLISHYLHDKYEELEKAANNYDPSIEERIFQLIKNDNLLESEFLRQLSKSENPSPWLRPLKGNGYFNPQNNPMATSDYGSYWNAMGALENIAKVNNKDLSKEITGDIKAIIGSIIDYRDENKRRIENILTDRHIIRIIFLLPSDDINEQYLDFVKNCLHFYHENILIAIEIGEFVIPRLVENENCDLLLNILDISLGFMRTNTSTFEEYTSVLSPFYLQTIIKKFTTQIILTCGSSAIRIALQKIEQIIAEDPSQFNEVWLPSVKEENEFKDRYDTQIIQFIWLGLRKLETAQIKEIIVDLLDKEHPIFKRIALSIIDDKYTEFKDLFWNLKTNPLPDYHLKNELYELFSNHCKEFSDNEVNTIIEWIETYHEEQIPDEENEEQEKYLAYVKKEWLLALLPTGSSKVQTLFNHYDCIDPTKISHPGRNLVIEHFSDLTSPITKEELIQKNNTEIVDYLNTFEDEIFGKSSISRHSLCEIFRNSIIEYPQKYVQDLDPFLNSDRVYQYEIFLGLFEAWRKEKEFRWDKLLHFINSILESENFWTDSYPEGQFHYRDWIISRIAILIEEGTKNDTNLLDLELLPEVENVLLILAKNSESDLSNYGDLVTSVLNSNKGCIYSAMINYSLCFARHNRINEEIRWPEAIKEDFEKRLNPDIEPTVEFSVTLGKYLSNLCYLDKEWVQVNFNRIFPKDDNIHWNAAFSAYLFYSQIRKDIYILLKENGHYSKAISNQFEEPRINERLIQHICIGYLEGIENLEDEESLIYQILETWNSEQIVEIIRFLRWFNKNIDPEKRLMIIPLWKKIVSKISLDIENPNNIKILSELNKWIALVDELTDEICGWLKLSVKHIRQYDIGFIEQLRRHSETKPKCAGELFLTIVESGNFNEFQKDEIIKFVSILYEKKETENADRICNLYLSAGIDFLKPVYGKHM